MANIKETLQKEFQYLTHNDGEIPFKGNSLQGYVSTDYSTLVAAFGEPTTGDEYKTDWNWEIQLKEGDVLSVYNYKDGPNYLGDEGKQCHEIFSWHVGGKNKKDVQTIREILLGAMALAIG